ncbi:MAG: ATP--guanido phosphotransferase, partial [Clostridia bacterium]|nr:ATP--guanido phosphotransferase [Clostridia bacterium]
MAAIPEKIETIVTSTRLRLARNLSAYPFPSVLKGKEAEDVLILTKNALGKLDKFREYDMWKLGEEEAMLLQEQHLISPALRKKREGAAAFISTDTRVSVMV